MAVPAGRKACFPPGMCPRVGKVAGGRGQASVVGIFDPFRYPYLPSSQFYPPPMPQSQLL